MAEIDNTLNTGNSLMDLTIENSYINYYITDNPNRLLQSGDNGDMIIYVSDGIGVFEQDKERNTDIKNTYTDIYIGNEHIAGGFGFKDINTRNKVLNDITYIASVQTEHYTYLNQKVSFIENSKINPVSINETKRFIQLDNGDEYELRMNSRNEISVIKNHRVSINDIDILYYLNDEVTNIQTLNLKDNTKFISVEDVINIVGFNAVVESSEYIMSFNLSYIMPKFDDNNKLNTEISKNINTVNAENECYKLTEVSYPIIEDEKYVWISRFEEKFDTPITIRSYNNLNYDIRFRLIARTDKYDSAIIYTPSIKFTHPIYYFCSAAYGINSIEGLTGVNKIVDYKLNENNRLVFTHDINDPSYGFILIPRYWYDDGYRPEFYFYDQLSIRTDFDFDDENASLSIAGIQYTKYRTPNMYNGMVEWDFKLRLFN